MKRDKLVVLQLDQQKKRINKMYKQKYDEKIFFKVFNSNVYSTLFLYEWLCTNSRR